MKNERITKLKKKLKEIIDARGITVTELSDMAEISDACIRYWFGKRDYCPSLDKLFKVCDSLDINICELFVENDSETYPLTKDEKLLIKEWNKLNSVQKDAVLIHIESYRKK